MQIFLALNTNFLTLEPTALHWIRLYCDSLAEIGIECVFFDVNSGTIPEDAVIHFFSRFDAETWKVLADSGRRVIITPAIATGIPGIRFDWLRSSIDLWLRKYLFRLKHDSSESKFRKSGCHYLVADEEVKHGLTRFWGIDQELITTQGLDPKNAALVASSLYKNYHHHK